MEITLVRSDPKPWGVDGRLKINRQYVCDTVEHPTRHLPEGDYLLGPSLSLAAHSDRLALPHPFRHGDGALSAIHGEIIVGKQLLPGVVTASKETYDRLYERLKKAFQRGSSVHLQII